MEVKTSLKKSDEDALEKAGNRCYEKKLEIINKVGNFLTKAESNILL